MSAHSAETGKRLGFQPGFGPWVSGRAGAMGEVPAEVAAGAIGFMEPTMAIELWNSRPASVSALDAAYAYAQAASAWARETWADAADDDLERLAELAAKVADSALPVYGGIFAGWRALERPEEPAGRVAVILNVLRELRGGAHLTAIQAVGLTPHDAIISVAKDSVRGGVAGAERFGWPAPHPEPQHAARVEAETITTAITAPIFDVLTDSERSEFAGLIARVRKMVEM